MPRELNVLALIKGDEHYVYVYDDASRAELIDALRNQAAKKLGFANYHAMQQYRGTSQLNEAYFGMPPKPKPVPGKPGSQPEEESVDPD